MSTLLPVIEPDDLAGGSFVMTFHEVLDHELNLYILLIMIAGAAIVVLGVSRRTARR